MGKKRQSKNFQKKTVFSGTKKDKIQRAKKLKIEGTKLKLMC
jgi:hypothetical protein